MKYSTKRFFFKYPRRSFIQLFFAVVFVLLGRMMWGAGGAHNLCPWTIVEVPILMLRIGAGLFYFIGVIIGIMGIATTFLYPRPFCGWICPLGTIFDFLADVGERAHISAKRKPHWLNEKLRFASYGAAGLLIILTFVKGSLVCTVACPAFWICTAGTVSIPIVTVIIMAIILILSIRIRRGFCRYICPYGALTAIFVPLSRKKIWRNLEVCNSCGICRDICPMGIDVMRDIDVSSAHCISCGECIAACPKNALMWNKKNN